MESNRLKLDKMLRDLLGSDYVYFQPPESLKIKYPAIIYRRNGIVNDYADNNIYNQTINYSITVIDYDVDSEVVSKIARNRQFKYDRHYKSDNLNHDVFTINI